MTAPIIGITTARSLSATGLALLSVTEAYAQAVLRAGGIPVLIPVGLPAGQLETLVAHLDGVLLSGGGDMDPALFDGQPHPRVGDVDPDRDTLEVALVRRFVELDRPFFGICRGCQVVNVALGGTLFTDIGDQFPGAPRHDWYPNFPRNHIAHTVRLEPGSRLIELVGSGQARVNSLHHQGVKDLAPTLVPSAYSPEGLVEGVELPGHRFGLAVQWHPEWLPDAPEMQSIFRGFVNAAQG